MSNPRHGAVVGLNWNGWHETSECLQTLIRLCYEPSETYVVDNLSHDGLGERLHPEHEDIQLIENEENLGFAGGCNVGIRRGLETGADYILLFNSDATAEPTLLRNLIDVAESSPEMGILGPTLLQDDGSTVWYQGGTINRSLGYTRHPGMGKPVTRMSGRAVSTGFVTGCVMLVKRELLETIGLLEEDYFLYVDDVDFSERARRSKFQVLHCPSAVARHKVSASAGIKGSNVLTPLRAYYYARNMVLFIRRHLTGVKKWTALQGQIYIRAPYRLLSLPIDGQMRSLRPYLEGLWHGLVGVTGKWGQHDRWVS